MFTQISLSSGQSNYVFKIKLNDEALNTLSEKKDLLKKFKEERKVEMSEMDEYNGELLGLNFGDDIDKEYMLKELNKWKVFFEKCGLDVYDAKILTLKSRLKSLEGMSAENKDIVSHII